MDSVLLLANKKIYKTFFKATKNFKLSPGRTETECHWDVKNNYFLIETERKKKNDPKLIYSLT